MPVMRGLVGDKSVDVLRDTGCSGIVVTNDLISEEQHTTLVVFCLSTIVRKVPIARITVNTSYLTDEVEAQCLPEPIYDVIIGNVPGARAADDPDPSWQKACAVKTWSQPKKKGQLTPLKVASTTEDAIFDKNKLLQLQHEHESLQKYWNRNEAQVNGQREVLFETKNRVLYRSFKHPHVNGGKPMK